MMMLRKRSWKWKEIKGEASAKTITPRDLLLTRDQQHSSFATRALPPTALPQQHRTQQRITADDAEYGLQS